MPSGGAFSFCSDFKVQHPRLALLLAVAAIFVGPLAYSHRHLVKHMATESSGKDHDHSSNKKSPPSLPYLTSRKNLLPSGMSPTSFAKLIESGRTPAMKLHSHESTGPSAQLAAEKAAKMNASAIEESSRIQAQGNGCCCISPDGRKRGNPPGLRGLCPAKMCTMMGNWPWQMEDCSAQYSWTCFKRSGYGVGCLGAGDSPPVGYQLNADPVTSYQVIEGSMKEFVCPDGCQHCCRKEQQSRGGIFHDKFLCMNDLKPDPDWKTRFPELANSRKLGGRNCEKPKSNWKEAGWSMNCEYTEEEKNFAPWDHGINPVGEAGSRDLDEEPCSYGKSDWEKETGYDDFTDTKLYQEARIRTLEAMVNIVQAVGSPQCVKVVGKELKSLITSSAFKPLKANPWDVRLYMVDMVAQAYTNPKVYESFGDMEVAQQQLGKLSGQGGYEEDDDGWMNEIILNSDGHHATWCSGAWAAQAPKLMEKGGELELS